MVKAVEVGSFDCCESLVQIVKLLIIIQPSIEPVVTENTSNTSETAMVFQSLRSLDAGLKNIPVKVVTPIRSKVRVP